MTTYTWPAPPAPGSIVRGKFWTFTTDEEGYWGGNHRDDAPDKREFNSNPLNVIHAHGPFQVSAPDGTEYTLEVPDAPPVGTRVKGGKTGKVYELVDPAARPNIFAELRREDNSGGVWVAALRQEGTMTVLSS